MGLTKSQIADRKAEKAAYLAAAAKRYAEADAIVAAGHCPHCKSALRRNLSLSGWWTCEQRGAVTHRARPSDPHCSFDCFASEAAEAVEILKRHGVTNVRRH